MRRRDAEELRAPGVRLVGVADGELRVGMLLRHRRKPVLAAVGSGASRRRRVPRAAVRRALISPVFIGQDVVIGVLNLRVAARPRRRIESRLRHQTVVHVEAARATVRVGRGPLPARHHAVLQVQQNRVAKRLQIKHVLRRRIRHPVPRAVIALVEGVERAR